MEVKQIYEFVNNATKEAIGESAVVKEDLSNIVDVGTAVLNANAYDRYVGSLVNQIGKVIFVSRKYEGIAPKVMMDEWEYGSVVEKIRMDIPDATENPTWKLVDGETYSQDKFIAPKIHAKFYNSKTTFEVPISIVYEQVKQSFISPQQLNGFIEMIYSQMDNGMTQKTDELVLRTIGNMIGETIYADYGDSALGSKSGVKAINILKLYNDRFGRNLKTADCLYDVEFLKFAGLIVRNTTRRIRKMSSLFNATKTTKFTPDDRLHLDLLSDFASATGTYLQSSTFHDELVRLPNYEEIEYWQGTGTDYSSNATLNITTTSGHDVAVTGIILGVAFDRDALGVYNYNKRVPTHENKHAEFWNLWYKQDASYFNDLDENFIVFFAQDAE